MQTHDNFQVGMRELIKVCQLIFFILVLMPNGPFSLTAYSSFCGWSIAGQPHPPSLPPPPKKKALFNWNKLSFLFLDIYFRVNVEHGIYV